MRPTRSNALIALLLLATSLIATSAEAKHKSAKHVKKQARVITSADPAYSIQMTRGNMTLSDGVSETTISKDPNDAQPIVNGNEVYFIHNEDPGKNVGSSVYVFNISTKAKENIIKPNAADANYDLKNKIGNILIDKRSNNMFFSTSLTKATGYEEKLTWKYNIDTKKLEVYKDGSIESIEAAGNQVIAMHSGDAKGPYTMRTLVDTEGRVQKVIGKQYDLISQNK